MTQAGRRAVIGVVIGLGAAVGASRALRSQLFEIAPTDLFTYVVVGTGLLIVALLASWIRRGAHRALIAAATVMIDDCRMLPSSMDTSSLPTRASALEPSCSLSRAEMQFPAVKDGPARRHATGSTCVLEAIAAASKGDMLVIDNGGRNDEGCIGDLVVGEAYVSGLAATICWGTHRDTAAIQAMGARVWSLGTCPNGPLELRRRVTTALSAANIGSSHVRARNTCRRRRCVVVVGRQTERSARLSGDIAARRAHRRAPAEGRVTAGELELDHTCQAHADNEDPVRET